MTRATLSRTQADPVLLVNALESGSYTLLVKDELTGSPTKAATQSLKAIR